MPEFPILEGTVLTARQWRALSFRRRTAWTITGLAALAHLLRDRNFYTRVIVTIIVLKAISQISRKDLAVTFQAIMKWDNKRLAEYVEERRRHEAEVGRTELHRATRT